jgi:hypothetical protein
MATLKGMVYMGFDNALKESISKITVYTKVCVHFSSLWLNDQLMGSTGWGKLELATEAKLPGTRVARI